jgi:hypothetical protein
MLQYALNAMPRSSTKYDLPNRQTIRRRVMKLGEDVTEGTRAMFKVRRSDALLN